MKLLISVALVAGAAVVLEILPDIARYFEMREM